MATFAERRTQFANRLFGGTRLLDAFHAGHTLVDGRVGENGILVEVTSLDDFVREQALPGLDVVKLDVEGAELLAIDGMREILGGARRPAILCEVHPPIKPED